MIAGNSAPPVHDSDTFASLDDHHARDIREFGGKASRLAMMRQAGFSVPDGFVIGISAFDELFGNINVKNALKALTESSDCSVESNQLLSAIDASQLPASIVVCLDMMLDKLGPLAVRSSAVREDGIQRAGAGQYLSILGVNTHDDVLAACKGVIASQYSTHALKYWGDNSAGIGNGMAVLLQRMLSPSASGVIFTRDPRGGREDTLVLEASPGLATSVVDGTGVSERTVVERTTYGIVERDLCANRNVEFFDPVVGGLVRSVSPDGDPRPVLSTGQLVVLVETACAVEDFFSAPVDIEWSFEDEKLVLLQARPITTLLGSST